MNPEDGFAATILNGTGAVRRWQATAKRAVLLLARYGHLAGFRPDAAIFYAVTRPGLVHGIALNSESAAQFAKVLRRPRFCDSVAAPGLVIFGSPSLPFLQFSSGQPPYLCSLRPVEALSLAEALDELAAA